MNLENGTENGLLAAIMVVGDTHFKCDNYGGHVNYGKEVLYYERKLNEIAREKHVTHYISTGDLTYGKFNKLEYRQMVDCIFDERNTIVGGNFYMVKGNHDKASYGKTEYEYYLEKNTFKGSCSLDIGIERQYGGLHIQMNDFGDMSEFNAVNGAVNILITHGYFTFKNAELPYYGKSECLLDTYSPWIGADLILAGHIHEEHLIRGKIMGKEIGVHYLPCLSRPALHANIMTESGNVDIIYVDTEGNVTIEMVPVELLPVEQCFRLEALKRNAQEDANDLKYDKIDFSDIVKRLAGYEKAFGDPIERVRALENVPDVCKERAIDWLMRTM